MVYIGGIVVVGVAIIVVILFTFVLIHVLVMQLFILAGTDFGLVIFVTEDNGSSDDVDGSTTVVTRKRDVDMGAGKLVGEQLFDGGGVIGDVLVSTTRDT